jgi:hypothetical protein
MREMRRAIEREDAERQKQDRLASTLVIAASLIAAVRLARDQDICRPSPRLRLAGATRLAGRYSMIWSGKTGVLSSKKINSKRSFARKSGR